MRLRSTILRFSRNNQRDALYAADREPRFLGGYAHLGVRFDRERAFDIQRHRTGSRIQAKTLRLLSVCPILAVNAERLTLAELSLIL